MSDDSANAGLSDEPSVGKRLQQARGAKGLTLEQAAEEMRLSEEVLGALEADRFDILGAQVFVRGHLRQYAQLLGLDADEVMQRYSAQDHPSDDPIVGLEPIRLRDTGELRVWIALGAVLLVLVALFMWWRASPDTQDKAAASGPAVSSVEPTAVPVAAAPTAASEQPSAEAAASPDEMSHQPDADVSLDTPVTSSVDLAADEPEPTVAVTWSVEIVFEQDCWVEIVGGDDRRLFYGMGRAGARSRFEARPPMSVLLGNADGVQIALNGSAYPIPVGARQGNLARFVVVDAP